MKNNTESLRRSRICPTLAWILCGTALVSTAVAQEEPQDRLLTVADRVTFGHRMRSVKVTARPQQRTIPRGTYLIRTAQALGNLAGYLLEPSADGSLTRWNFFDHALAEGEDHPVLRVPSAVDVKSRPVDRVDTAQRRALTAKPGSSST